MKEYTDIFLSGSPHRIPDGQEQLTALLRFIIARFGPIAVQQVRYWPPDRYRHLLEAQAVIGKTQLRLVRTGSRGPRSSRVVLYHPPGETIKMLPTTADYSEHILHAPDGSLITGDTYLLRLNVDRARSILDWVIRRTHTLARAKDGV